MSKRSTLPQKVNTTETQPITIDIKQFSKDYYATHTQNSLLDAIKSTNIRRSKHAPSETSEQQNIKSLDEPQLNTFLAELIELGADVNAKDNSGKTPLFDCKNTETAELLISKGVDVNARDDIGRTPLFGCRNTELAELLISKGADVNARDNDGKTPIFDCEDTETAELLISKGADVNVRDDIGRTPLFGCWNTEIAELLISKGADVNARDNSGKTPLFDCKDTETAELLINNGANVNARDNIGRTPLFGCRNTELAELLISKGADVNAKDNNNLVPLQNLLSNSEAWNNDNDILGLTKLYIAHGLNIHATNSSQQNYLQIVEKLHLEFFDCTHTKDDNNFEAKLDLMNLIIDSDPEFFHQPDYHHSLKGSFKLDHPELLSFTKNEVMRQEDTTKSKSSLEYCIYYGKHAIGLFCIDEIHNLDLIKSNYKFYFCNESCFKSELKPRRLTKYKDEPTEINNELISKLNLPFAYINWIYIVSDYRGKGIFKNMFKFIMDDLKEYKHIYLRADAMDGNLPALIAKYQSVGMELIEDYGECVVMGYSR